MRINPISAQAAFLNYPCQPEKISSSPGKIDVVTLSEEGKMMQAQVSENNSSLIGTLENFMDGAGKDGVITLDEIQAFGQKNLQIAENILTNTLEQLNISSDSKISIHTDKEGLIRVNSDLSTSDNDRLEAALNKHPDFQQAFTKASSNQSLVNAAEKHMEFAQAYAQDPKSAVAQYNIGSSSSGEYVLQYALGQTALVFQNSVFQVG
ncbi:hypothetical protein [Desulfospira joergensenii]|uniref:hypothetical protein n=1 Tax=Desulfospira joergensenii TaxID=53329 RepID=UPI0003B707FC|nr:hypothetical protein [Desulfospira joergensenii]